MSSTLKVVLLFAMALLCIRLAAAFFTNKQAHSQNSNAGQTSPAKNAYLGLRDQILHLKREKAGIAAPSKSTEPWAAVMDWGVDNGTATIVAISDGTASVYLSGGGGSIGGGQSHDSIRKAAQKMVVIAGEVQPQMRPADTCPLPQRGHITFYVLTDAGVFTASASQDELSSHRHPLSSLGAAAQEIITQYRLIQKSNGE